MAAEHIAQPIANLRYLRLTMPRTILVKCQGSGNGELEYLEEKVILVSSLQSHMAIVDASPIHFFSIFTGEIPASHA